MTVPLDQHRYSVNEYLQFEQTSHEKHEYRSGRIVAMAGGTENHSLISVNIIRELSVALRGKPCRVYDSNLRVRSSRVSLYTYPDAFIICGKTELDPDDRTGQTIINPRVIIEVLSPSTEAYDRGAKMRSYLMLDSLEEYVLVDQDLQHVETYFRQADGTWSFSATREGDATVRLRSLGLGLAMADLYRDVQFPPDPAIAPQPARQ